MIAALTVEAIDRFSKPIHIEGWLMILISVMGLVFNLIMISLMGESEPVDEKGEL